MEMKQRELKWEAPALCARQHKANEDERTGERYTNRKSYVPCVLLECAVRKQLKFYTILFYVCCLPSFQFLSLSSSLTISIAFSSFTHSTFTLSFDIFILYSVDGFESEIK